MARAIALTDANSEHHGQPTAMAYSGEPGGQSTATVTLTTDTGGIVPCADAQTLVDGLAYENASEDPSTAPDRVVTLTAYSGQRRDRQRWHATPRPRAIASTVTLTPVNDAPTLGATADRIPTFTEGGAAADLFSGVRHRHLVESEPDHRAR